MQAMFTSANARWFVVHDRTTVTTAGSASLPAIAVSTVYRVGRWTSPSPLSFARLSRTVGAVA